MTEQLYRVVVTLPCACASVVVTLPCASNHRPLTIASRPRTRAQAIRRWEQHVRSGRYTPNSGRRVRVMTVGEYERTCKR